MLQAKKAVTFFRAVLLLATAAACSDLPVTPSTPGEPSRSSAAPASVRSPRDVPEVHIALPPAPRPWDIDRAALTRAVSAGEGYAVVAFKEPGSARALAAGKRAAVTAGTVRAGLQLLERNGVEVLDLLDAIGGARVRISPAAAVEIAGHALIDFVEPRQYGRLQAQVTPWGVTMVGAPAFWSTQGTSGAGAKIEIIDTGHQQGHVDLPSVATANCAGVYGGCNDASTASWHGTHVLGIASARNNTDGVVGVAPGIAASDVYVYGACDNNGICPTDQVTAGINTGIWNVHVMNLSLTQPYDAAQATAIAQAWSNGIVIVAAAGNNMSNTTIYPAAYPNVLGVSGVLSNKAFAASGTTTCGYSNYGSHVDLSAPFEAYSTIGLNSYGTLCGTSMAAPHVTGVAALIKAKNPAWTNQQIVNHLLATAEDRGAIGWDPYYGYGIVRALGSVRVNISGATSITTAGSYTWTASASGGNGTYTYNWEYRVQGGTWTSLGITSATYTRSVAAGHPHFELRVTVTSAGQSGSDTHLVSVNIPTTPLDVIVSGSDYLLMGDVGFWNATVTGASGAVTYQWQYRTELGTTWTNVGTGTSSYSRSAPLRSFYVRVIVTSGGASDTSDPFYVFVDSESCEIDPASGQRICW